MQNCGLRLAGAKHIFAGTHHRPRLGPPALAERIISLFVGVSQPGVHCPTSFPFLFESLKRHLLRSLPRISSWRPTSRRDTWWQSQNGKTGRNIPLNRYKLYMASSCMQPQRCARRACRTALEAMLACRAHRPFCAYLHTLSEYTAHLVA